MNDLRAQQKLKCQICDYMIHTMACKFRGSWAKMIKRISNILLKKDPVIEILCVTYRQPGSLKVLVQSFLNQTNPNWLLNVIHDGHDDEFNEIMFSYSQNDERITYSCSSVRYNDWGHSLRNEGIKTVKGDYLLITNGDNYYAPVLIQTITENIKQYKPDVVMFDMVHSHELPGGRK